MDRHVSDCRAVQHTRISRASVRSCYLQFLQTHRKCAAQNQARPSLTAQRGTVSFLVWKAKTDIQKSLRQRRPKRLTPLRPLRRLPSRGRIQLKRCKTAATRLTNCTDFWDREDISRGHSGTRVCPMGSKSGTKFETSISARHPTLAGTQALPATRRASRAICAFSIYVTSTTRSGRNADRLAVGGGFRVHGSPARIGCVRELPNSVESICPHLHCRARFTAARYFRTETPASPPPKLIRDCSDHRILVGRRRRGRLYRHPAKYAYTLR
jgi:hypothetical protein